MIDTIREMLSYPFLVRAIVVGLLVSVCASLVGVSLVLKRFSMIGDGLSHVGFGALASLPWRILRRSRSRSPSASLLRFCCFA